MYGKTYLGIVRSAFLVGRDGWLARAFYEVSPADTMPKARKAVDAAAG